jgi:hypothetical protein
MSDARCPLCEQPLYGWITTPRGVVDRCESCGVAIERGAEVDLGAELEALRRTAGEGGVVRCPNRASLQAALGGEGWAALDRYPGRLVLTPRSLELLAERGGQAVEDLSFPPLGTNQGWMWQTLLNGLTFHPNFVREVRAGRLRAADARSRAAFAIDAVVSVVAAPLIALVSLPLELGACVARRGGLIECRLGATPASVAP